MRSVVVAWAVIFASALAAQDRLLLTALPSFEAKKISDLLAAKGIRFRVEALSEELEARLSHEPYPDVLYAIDGFALVELYEVGRLQVLPETCGDRLEPFWSDPGRHLLITMADPWVIVFDSGAFSLGMVPSDFDALLDPSLEATVTLPVPRSSPSLWMAWIQDQFRQGYSEERAFAWLSSLDARVVGYEHSVESCIRSLDRGDASISVLPLRQALAAAKFDSPLDYRLPRPRIPLRGLGIAALTEIDAQVLELLDLLLDADLALHLARSLHILPCPRDDLSADDLPMLMRTIMRDAMPYRPLMGNRDDWFARWEQRVKGHGQAVEQLSDWLDLVFGVAFLGLLAFIYSRTRTIDERS